MRNRFWGSCLAWPLLAAIAAADEPVDYVRDVKSVLAANCYRCHGPDVQKSELRLDSVAAIKLGGNLGASIVPGKSAESYLLQALTGTGDALKMPPEGEGEPLTPEQIDKIKSWIDQGAPAPADDAPAPARPKASDHWSFKPIVDSPLPAVAKTDWLRQPLDAFVLARLEAAGLAPSPEADRTTLIRRASFDLLGLPPDIAAVDQFLADTAPDAYERMIDRLLESPHYGERWGRHWLDLARYADSNGYTIDSGRSIWKYRDWVIDSLNRDLPFDQFAIEQIAGDMLPDATVEQKLATGFHRNTLKNEEGGTDPEQFRVEAVVDRISTTGQAFLGLTLGCARCHDHKYDPISQREFYQLFAIFNNADEPTLPVKTDKQSKEEPALLADIAQVSKRLADSDSNSGKRQVEWETLLAAHVDPKWVALDAIELKSAGGATLSRLDDKSVLVSKSPATDTYTIVADLPAGGGTAFRLEALTHDSLPMRGPGTASNGNFVLHEASFAMQRLPAAPLAGGAVTNDAATNGAAGTPSELPPPAPLALLRAGADHSQQDYPIANAIDANPKTGWAINVASGSMNVDRAAVFVLKEPLPAEGRVRITLTLAQQQEGYALGRFRLSVATCPPDATTLSPAAREALAIAPEARSQEQKDLLTAEFRKVDKERLPLAASLAELEERKRQLDAAITTTLVMQERPEPRETFVHLRGDFLRPGAKVTPAGPAVLPPIESGDGIPDRLDFARWLVAPKNPLTARVTVNRVWQQYFGQGLATTENDFGLQGAPPTHPEMLDWLATEFMRRKWSLKQLHRLITTSATYRQSSAYRADLAAADPYNRLLGRQQRLRVEAEVVRDAALTASGLLSREIGGPSVYPPQPAGIYRFTQQVKYWTESTGADRYRRGLYTYFWRSSPYPFLKTFDAPDANTACTRRVRSNTPLQSLTLANDMQFVEAARALARRILAESAPSDDERLTRAFRHCLSRAPAPEEQSRLATFLKSQRDHYATQAEQAAAFAGEGLPAGVAPPEAAAWTAVARVLINLDEFITRE